jgi:hypothetical protein
MKTHAKALGTIIGIVLVTSIGVAHSAPIATITDEGSTASFDLGDGSGMFRWQIGEVEHIAQQWFWYRTGTAEQEVPIDTLGNRFYGTTDANFDGDHETLYVRYENGQLRVTVMFVLNGTEAGNPSADIAESIQITNLTAGSLDLHFFQFCDFDLGGTATDQSVRIIDGRSAQQEDVGYYASETVITPSASHWQVDLAPNIIASLNDGTPTTLNDVAGPVGPGNLGWAFQWDTTLEGGESFLISKDKQIVPEPATMGLLALGAVALIRRKM